MSKIKQARAWLTKKERTNDSEKRGDITLQQIIWTAVAVILIGLVVGILVVILNRQGDQAADSAAELSANIQGEPAIYNAACNTNRAIRAGTIAVVDQVPTAGGHVAIPWNAAGGYGLPDGSTFATPGATAAGPALGYLDLTNSTAATNFGFFAAASRITEARFNADFDGDGEVESEEVIGVVANGGNAALAAFGTTIGTHSIQADNRGEFSIADPTGAIAEGTVAVGRQLLVNRSDDCWRIA